MVHRELDIIQWATDRKIIQNGSAKTQAIKTAEEVVELLAGCESGNLDEIKDAVGDIIVTLANVAALSGTNLTECIEGAWNEIKDRKGYLNENGIFVKEV